RAGMAKAEPIEISTVSAMTREHRFTRRDFPVERLTALRAEHEAAVATAGKAAEGGDAEKPARMGIIYLAALSRIESHLAAGGADFEPLAELQAMKIGPIT